MVKYRRNFIPGGIYFFTVALLDRQSNWLTKYIHQLTAAFRRVNAIHPYQTLAMVVLPDHLHTIWKLPEKDANYSLRWRYIKTFFAKNLQKCGIKIDKNRYGENILWQRRFWEHTICDEIDYARHVDYIHYNPMKHGLVNSICDWPYSTFHKYVKEGLLPNNWCGQDNGLNVE